MKLARMSTQTFKGTLEEARKTLKSVLLKQDRYKIVEVTSSFFKFLNFISKRQAERFISVLLPGLDIGILVRIVSAYRFLKKANY